MEFFTKTSVLNSQLFVYNWSFLAFYFSGFCSSTNHVNPLLYVPLLPPIGPKTLQRAAPIDWTLGLRLP